MASTRLYSEALEQFRQNILARRKQSDNELLSEFLRDGRRSSLARPSSIKEAAAQLATDAEKKYSTGIVPKAWIDKIMGNVDNIIAVGGFLTKNAPESVGMAWFAISLTLKAIGNNYNLYALFGQGLTDITEVMIIIMHYDRLYDERQTPGFKVSDLIDKLFRDTIAAYAAVLDFAFSVKKHLSGGSMDKVKHAFKDFFGAQAPKFQGKLSNIAELKGRILESSQGAFQDKTMQRFGDVQAALTQIQNDYSQGLELQHEQRQILADMYSDLLHLKDSIKRKTPWEELQDEFIANKKKLSPLPDAQSTFRRLLARKQEGTCRWIFENGTYQKWANSNPNIALCILGSPGSGKSTVLASIAHQLEVSTKPRSISVCYVSCLGPDSGQSAAPGTPLLTRIQNTLIYQTYRLAAEDEDQMSLLENCNRIFRNPKKDNPGLGTEQASQNHTLPDFVQAMKRLVTALQRSIILTVDATEMLSDSDQQELYESLCEVLPDSSVDNRITILIGSHSNSRIAQLASSSASSIDLSSNNNNRKDMEMVLDSCVKNLPGWLDQEKKQAKVTVLAKAGSSFTYIGEVAIPFLQQPFQRPITAYLSRLPESMNESFGQALLSIAPNYFELLRLAVTWCLLCPRKVTVKEILETYSGVYAIEQSENPNISDDEYNQQATALEVQQMSSASGPFLALERMKNGQTVVKLQDARQVRNFCLHAPKSEAIPDDNSDRICESCKSAMKGESSLHVDPKIAHCEIALTLLKNLNSPLFQARFGLLQDPDTNHSDDNSETSEEDHNEESEYDGEDYSGDDDGDNDVEEKHDEDDDEEAEEAEAAAVAAEEEELEDEDDESFSQASADEVSDYFWSDPNVDWLVQGGNPNIPIYTRELDLRCEIMDWPYHLREIEKLWPIEERAKSPLWLNYNQRIQAELLRFTSNEIVFKNWQKLWQVETLCGSLKSPICLAATLGLTVWVENLLDSGADINQISGTRNVAQSSGEFANVHQNVDLLQLLLRRGADFSYAKPHDSYAGLDDSPALHLWLDLYGTERAVIEALVEHETDFGIRDQWGWTGLHTFAWRMRDVGSFDLIMKSCAKKPNINARDNFGETPVFKLLWRRDVPLELLKAFLAVEGINISHDANNSQQPLALASQWGSLEIVKLLIEAKADLHDRDNRRRTALHRAAEGGHVKCIEALLDAGMELDSRDGAGFTSLQYAAWNGHQAAVQCLVDRGSNMLSVDYRNRNALFNAILGQQNDQRTAVILLTEMMATEHAAEDINVVTKGGRTALRQTAARGFVDVLQNLLKYIFEWGDTDCKATVDLGDARSKQTPLHCAALQGNPECVRLLISYGADAKRVDRKGRTPLMLATKSWSQRNEKSFEDVVLHLIDAEHEAAIMDPELSSIAAANGSIQVLRKLRDLQADLTTADSSGWTPLAHARFSDQKAASDFLRHNISWGSNLPSRWVESDNLVILHDTGLQVKRKAGDRACITTDRSLPPSIERFYYEVTIKKLGKDHDLAIGFCTLAASAHKFPGLQPKSETPSALSWAYHGNDGCLHHNTPSNDAVETGERFSAGDTIGCGVDLESRTIWFTRNGRKLSQSLDNVKGRLFPVLGLSAPVLIQTNFGRQPFLWKNEKSDQ